MATITAAKGGERGLVAGIRSGSGVASKGMPTALFFLVMFARVPTAHFSLAHFLERCQLVVDCKKQKKAHGHLADPPPGGIDGGGYTRSWGLEALGGGRRRRHIEIQPRGGGPSYVAIAFLFESCLKFII